MSHHCRQRCLSLLVLVAAASCACGVAAAPSPSSDDGAQRPPGAAREARGAKPHVDRSGRRQVGIASVYARRFAGRKMADGTPMEPHDDSAASKTLPLGTRAKVTNVETGRSATVTIRDRGPYVKGRIVDLTPATAEKIGVTKREGVAKVEVAPIAVPPRDDDGKR